MPIDWDAIRSQFPALKRWTHLNTAEFGQLSSRTSEAVARHFAHRDETACADFLDWFDDADRIREACAMLIHCRAEDIAFITNASTALALLMGGIGWQPGDRIVTLKNEFPNNIYFPAYLESRGVEFVETDWKDIYESISPSTRMVLMSAINYSNGFRPPLEEISTYLRERGIVFYVDGTQSAGALEFHAGRIRPSMFAVHGYKWLLSPNGAGFMYVAPEVRRWLQPNVIGWRSDRRWREVNQLHHGAPEFKDSAEKYEGGMLNFPSLYGMGESVKMMLEIGPAAIERRVMQLSARCMEILCAKGGEIDYPGSQILAARFPGRNAAAMARALRERRILVSARHGRLRVSVHFYNNEEDLSRLEEAL